MFCRYCGAKISEDALFCSKCGKQLRVAEPTGQSNTPPTAQRSVHTDDNAAEQAKNTASGGDAGTVRVGQKAGAVSKNALARLWKWFGVLSQKTRVPRLVFAALSLVLLLVMMIGLDALVNAIRFDRSSNLSYEPTDTHQDNVFSMTPDPKTAPDSTSDDFWGEDEVYAWVLQPEAFFALNTNDRKQLVREDDTSTYEYSFPYSEADAEKLFGQYISAAQEHFITTSVSDKFPRLGINFESLDGGNSGAIMLYYDSNGSDSVITVMRAWINLDDDDVSIRDSSRAKADFSGITPLDSSVSKPSVTPEPAATEKPSSGSSGKYDKDSGVIPDINAFSDYAFEDWQLGTEVYSDSTKISYAFDRNDKFRDEYLELLETYGFKLRDKNEYKGKFYYRNDYVYDYVGKAEGCGIFDADTSEVDNAGVAIFIYCYGGSITIRYADGFAYVDTGDRTSQKVKAQGVIGSSPGDSGSDEDYSPNVAGFAKQDCLTCGGSGKCPDCGGSGYLYSSASRKNDRDCSKCRASGRCPSCGGSGKR